MNNWVDWSISASLPTPIFSFIGEVLHILTNPEISTANKVAQIIINLAGAIAIMESAAFIGLFFANPFFAVFLAILVSVLIAALMLAIIDNVFSRLRRLNIFEPDIATA